VIRSSLHSVHLQQLLDCLLVVGSAGGAAHGFLELLEVEEILISTVTADVALEHLLVAVEGLRVHSDPALGGLVHQVEVDLLVPRGVRQVPGRLRLRGVARFEGLDHLLSVTHQILTLVQLVLLYVEVLLLAI
jgi:hypothetical protein